MSYSMSKRLTSKFPLATLTVTAACFSLTGFAAACGSGAQTLNSTAAPRSSKAAAWMSGHKATTTRSPKRHIYNTSPSSYNYKQHSDKDRSDGSAVARGQTSSSAMGSPASAQMPSVNMQPTTGWTPTPTTQTVANTTPTPVTTPIASVPASAPDPETTAPASVQNPSVQSDNSNLASRPNSKTSSHCDRAGDQRSGQNSQVGNQSDVTVNNIVTQSATSGKVASGADSETGTVSTTSGNASNIDTTSTVVTVASASAVPVTTTIPAGTSPSSTVYYTTTTGNVTDVTVNNIIEQMAVSGNVSASSGNWGGTVSSGNASNTANVVTYVVIND
jgi:hypothetical protein